MNIADAAEHMTWPDVAFIAVLLAGIALIIFVFLRWLD